MPGGNSATFEKCQNRRYGPSLTSKNRNFSSWRKLINKRFSILFGAYFNVLESFWVDLVVLLVWPVEILQCFKIGQNWPNRRNDPTLTPKIRNFSSFRKVINLRFQVVPRYYSDVLESLRVDIVVREVCLVVIRQHFANGRNLAHLNWIQIH